MILSKRAEVERFLAAPTPGARVLLIYGRDRAIVRERADAAASRIVPRPDDPFDVAQVTETDLETSASRLYDELSAQSLMGGRRLVRLRLQDKASADKAAAEAVKDHAAGKLNPDAVFLIEAGALGRDSALRKAAEADKAAVVIPCYEDEVGDVARMIREGLAKDKVSVTTEAMDLLTRRLPHERGVARQEIERLALFLGPGSGAVAAPADLDAFLGVEPEASLAEAAADAFGGRIGPAYAGLRRAEAEGDAGPAAVRAISLYLGRLRRTLTLTRSGAGLQEAAKASGVFWKSEKEFLRQARAWTLEQLDALQPDVLQADRACKQTGSPACLIAERLALSIAAKARRLGL